MEERNEQWPSDWMEFKTEPRETNGAEKVEREFYLERAPAAWLDAIRKLGTNEAKPYLPQAPALIAVWSRTSKENLLPAGIEPLDLVMAAVFRIRWN